MSRRVLFAEVPCFYASIEIAQDPALAGRPVIVGGDPRKRGLVQAASPEALAAGVEPEMPVIEALRLCPTARTLRTDIRLYRETSRRLVASLRREVDRLEPFGLGAAFVELAPGADAEAWPSACAPGSRPISACRCGSASPPENRSRASRPRIRAGAACSRSRRERRRPSSGRSP